MRKISNLVNTGFICIIACVAIILAGCSKKDDTLEIAKKGNLVVTMADSVVSSGTNIDFGSVKFFEQKQQTLTLTNSGDADLKFFLQYEGNFNSFDILIGTNDENDTITLKPNESKIMTVTFYPPTNTLELQCVKYTFSTLQNNDLCFIGFLGKGEYSIDPLAPPSWIQGAWANGDAIVYMFTSDNVRYASYGFEVFDAKASNENWVNTLTLDTRYYGEISDNHYDLFLKDHGNVTMWCSFHKTSDTTLEYNVNQGAIVTLTKK